MGNMVFLLGSSDCDAFPATERACCSSLQPPKSHSEVGVDTDSENR